MMNPRAHFWIVWLLSEALAIWLVMLCLPLPVSLAVGLSVLIVIAGLAVVLQHYRQWAQQKKTLRDVQPRIIEQLAALPQSWQQHLPLVLVLSDQLGLDATVRGNEQIIQVGIDTPARLPLLAAELTRWRGGKPPAALIWSLTPGLHHDAASLEARLSAWRVAMAQTRQMLGFSLPVYLLLNTPLPTNPANTPNEATPEPWLGLTIQGEPLTHYSALQQPAHQWQNWLERAASAQGKDISRRINAASLIEWLQQDVLPVLLGKNHLAVPISLQGIAIRDVHADDTADSPWGRFRLGQTGLQATTIHGQARGLLNDIPISWLQGIRAPRSLSSGWRLLLQIWLLILMALCMAFAASAWNNQQLLARLSNDVTHYRSLNVEQDAARQAALKTLSADVNELKAYADSGLPARLGFGFYRAQGWRPELEQLIADYRPPEAPPTTITLDSLSLFDSGQSTLKAGANRSLIKALTIIQAHPDKRILVAGHTDDVGNEATNLKLSAARAASVRDWLREAADLPVTRFAIQGYGATRPVADNHSEDGRARNRRVEITLLPDEAAH